MKTVKIDARAPRQRMWDSIRANRNDFTLELVSFGAGIKLDSARDYLRGLERAGFCEKTHEVSAFKSELSILIEPQVMQPIYHYRLINDVGNEAPRVNRMGKMVVDAATKNEAMWRALRMCGSVSARTLAAYASTDEMSVAAETANTYLKFLHRAGYLVVVQAAKTGVSQAVYRLLPDKNTGPKPPQIQRTKRVYDANLGAVMYAECLDDEHVRDGVEVCDVEA